MCTGATQGSSCDLTLTARHKAALSKGIVGLANSTNGWILTGGVDRGITKLVGEIVHANHIQATRARALPRAVRADVAAPA